MNRGRTVAFVVAATLGATSALAQEAPRASEAKDVCRAGAKETKAGEAPAGPGTGGLVVFKDPVTGQIRQPDAGEMRALLPPETRPQMPRTLVKKTGPGNAVGIVLDSSFESYLVVTKSPDGKLAMDCVTGEKKAIEVISGATVTAKRGNAPKEPVDVQ